MTKKIVDLKEYRAKKELRRQIAELDAMHDLYTVQEHDPELRKGYRNFMKFLKALDKKYEKNNDSL